MSRRFGLFAFALVIFAFGPSSAAVETLTLCEMLARHERTLLCRDGILCRGKESVATNLLGRVVMEGEDALSPGVYSIRFRDADGGVDIRDAGGVRVLDVPPAREDAEYLLVEYFRLAPEEAARDCWRMSYLISGFVVVADAEGEDSMRPRFAAHRRSVSSPHVAWSDFSPETHLCMAQVFTGSGTFGYAIAWPADRSFLNGRLDLFTSVDLLDRWTLHEHLDVTGVSAFTGTVIKAEVAGWHPGSSVAHTPDCALVTNIVESAINPGETYTNVAWNCDHRAVPESPIFLRAADETDSDGDGLTDAEEKWCHDTDPLDSDTDGDGLGDSWEVELGSNPGAADSDADGIPDAVEIGCIEQLTVASWVGMLDYGDIWTPATVSDSGTFVVDLPCPYEVNGVAYSQIRVCADGIFYLLNPERPSYAYTAVFPSDASLATTQLTDEHIVIAAFGSDLAVRAGPWGSSARCGYTEMASGPASVIEVEYLGFADDLGSGVLHPVSYQLVLPSGEKNVLYLAYPSVYPVEPYVEKCPVIGVQCPKLRPLREEESYYNLSWFPDARFFNARRTLKVTIGRGTDPGSPDTDGDGFSDADEIALLKTDPIVADVDTDADGLPDAAELRLGTDPQWFDTDYDGLDDREEIVLGTNPLQPDTDGDGLDDGWEHRYDGAVVVPPHPAGLFMLAPPGTSVPFDPTVDNDGDADPNNDPAADPDGDGLSNAEECAVGSSPCVPDTDDDGVSDYDEVAQGSDPTDATDEGDPSARVAVSFYFGDHSDSHSEKYRLSVIPVQGVGATPASFSRGNALYGECETNTVYLKPGWSYEVRLFHAGTHPEKSTDYDYTLQLAGAVPENVALSDPDSLFCVDMTSSYFAGEGKTSTIAVYAVTKVAVCRPDDQVWTEIEDRQVILDDEEFRVKIGIVPKVDSLTQGLRIFGDAITVKTSGTCPSGVSVPIGDDALLDTSTDMSEIRITKTRQQLISLGLLPVSSDDGVDEKSSYDVGDADIRHDSNISDSEVFQLMPLQFRGAANSDLTGNLESVTPVSRLSESFFKAAGVEFVKAEYAGELSDTVQIMNQADYFYVSGHGHHVNGQVDGYAPTALGDYWTRDLDCVIFACCSVLDIGNYNDVIYPSETTPNRSSPGKLWERVGPGVLLGYNASGPKDSGGAPARIMMSWLSHRAALGDVDAWMEANRENKAWNACAIVKGSRYLYFKKRRWGRHSVISVNKGEW